MKTPVTVGLHVDVIQLVVRGKCSMHKSRKNLYLHSKPYAHRLLSQSSKDNTTFQMNSMENPIRLELTRCSSRGPNTCSPWNPVYSTPTLFSPQVTLVNPISSRDWLQYTPV
jgi:hypothetical protein